MLLDEQAHAVTVYEYIYHSSCFPLFWRLIERITQGLPKHGKKVRLKFTLEQATNAQRTSRGIALLFFNLEARWGCVVSAIL